MVNTTHIRIRCETCQIKIPRAQPKLFCTICNKLKHLACQKLTKADAYNLIHLKVLWTCKECIFDILPVGACSSVPSGTHKKCNKFKARCFSCNGYSYSIRNVRTCGHCMKQVHLKCFNNDLGCTKCCESMIPGFYAYSYELIGDPYYKNDKIFNPYDSNHFTQLIGEVLGGEEETDQIFKDASELLANCKYKQAEKMETPSNSELSIFSLNVSTLRSKIEAIRENILFYDCFDVLLFNETNCKLKKLPNGEYDTSDIELDGFHKPVTENPIRLTGKGGGLAIYINKRVCADRDDIKSIYPYSEPDNTSGEFQFIKIRNCKGSRKTVVLGNGYCSPSRKPQTFNFIFEKFLQKLTNKRYSNKIK